MQYSINQEDYLKVFLTDGEVPMDDSASECALRDFTIGRKNWMAINTVRGSQSSAVIYSITETARANNLNVYYYIKHLLTELPQLVDKKIQNNQCWNHSCQGRKTYQLIAIASISLKRRLRLGQSVGFDVYFFKYGLKMTVMNGEHFDTYIQSKGWNPKSGICPLNNH